jgi:hypothetical protein
MERANAESSLTRGPESRPVLYLVLVQSFFNISLVLYARSHPFFMPTGHGI